MCNNSLFDDEWRQKCTGAKQSTEDTDVRRKADVVGEHFQRSEGLPVRETGVLGRENVGMSNRII